METFSKEIGSIYWWISAFGVGIIINIIAGFGYKYLDRWFTRLSKTWAIKKSKMKEEDLIKIEILRSSDTEKVIQSSLILYDRIRTNYSLILSLFYFLAGIISYGAALNGIISLVAGKIISMILLIFCLMLLFSAFSHLRSSIKENKLLFSSRFPDKVKYKDEGEEDR